MSEHSVEKDVPIRRLWNRLTGKAAIREHREWWASLTPEQQERERRTLAEAKLWDD